MGIANAFPAYEKNDLMRGALLALAYFITAQIGLSLSLLEHSVTVFWPPSGLSLAILLLYGVRLWPAVLIGSFCANAVSGLPFLTVLGMASGSTLEALLGYYLLSRHAPFKIELTEARDIFCLMWRGGILSTLASALIGPACLLASGIIEQSQFAQVMLLWWMGDGLGVVLFTPIVVSFLRHQPMQWTAARKRQVVLLYAATLGVCALVLTDLGTQLIGHQPDIFLLTALVIWAALSFDSRTVSIVLLAIAASSVFSAADSQGYFQSHTLIDIVDLWFFLVVNSMIGVTVAAVNFQRTRAKSQIELSEQSLKRAQHVAQLGSWRLEIPHNRLEWSEETYRIFGIAPGTPLTLDDFFACIHPEDMPMLSAAWQAALNGEKYEVEHRILVGGQVGWVREQAEFDFSSNGKPLLAIGTVQDISRRKRDEEEMRLAAKFFESTNEAILITDANNEIVTANHAFLKMSGYELEEIKGHNPRMFASGEHDADFYREMWRSIQETGAWQGELVDKNKHGKRFYKHMSINVVRNEQGVLTHYISIASDISERKEYDKNVHFLAYYDVLTGLPNRTLLRDRIGQMIAAAHRDEQRFALLFLDLDRFKYINDSMGHSVGDRLLQSVAQRLQNCVREGDTVSRIGGDEFIVLLREVDEEGVRVVADKLLKTLATPFDLQGQVISTFGSVGIALYPDHATDIDVLMKNADAAMYRAKEDGRNNFKFFTSDMNFRANQVFSMEKDIRVALEQDQFTLVYQPQVDLATGAICGAEALIRWKHPEKGYISPAEFIPIAEETGQIVAIGEWVLRTACWRMANWHKQGMAEFPVAVNLSIRQLRQPNLGDVIADVLKESGLKPELLELELTEGIMMGDTKSAMDFLNRMHGMGVQMSIDDFGTGFSSLNYLKNLPVHKLKIDQSFVRDIETDESDAAIVRSIISLGHRLNLKVIAEGVETQEQVDFMRIRGCDEIQGYFFSKPLAANDFFRFVIGGARLN